MLNLNEVDGNQIRPILINKDDISYVDEIPRGYTGLGLAVIHLRSGSSITTAESMEEINQRLSGNASGKTFINETMPQDGD